jgi:hypothetical protein
MGIRAFLYFCPEYTWRFMSTEIEASVERIKPVNIREIFYDKNPSLARWLPDFVFHYLEKIAHQHDINEFLKRHGDKYGLDFVRAAIVEFNVKVKVIGGEGLPRDGRYIFAANHPLGGFDGILLMDVLSRYYTDYKFLSNDLLMNIINLHPLFIPINKHGSNIGNVRLIDETFASDQALLFFPAGLCDNLRRRRGIRGLSHERSRGNVDWGPNTQLQ